MSIKWSLTDKGSAVAVSSDGLTVTSISVTNSVRADTPRSDKKWYWEITVESNHYSLIGISNINASISTNHMNTTNSRYYYNTGNKYPNNLSYGTSYTTGDTISVLLDLDNGNIEFWKNGVSQGVAFDDIKSMGEVYATISSGGGNSSVGRYTANFGASEFKYELPRGYFSYDGSQYGRLQKTLLKSNDKIYSLKSTVTKHETKMTSNTAPAPYIASSSANNTVTIFPYMAFDKSPETYWASATIVAPASPRIQIDFGSSKKVSHLVITARNGSTSSIMASSPKDFYIEGSNDNVAFTKVLDVKGEVDWKPLEKRVFALDKTVNYRHYRMFTTATNGINYLSIGELEYKNIELTEIPDASLANLIEYGTSDMKDFGYVLQNKSYVLQDGKSEDADGLWKQELSIKPLSIKFE